MSPVPDEVCWADIFDQLYTLAARPMSAIGFWPHLAPIITEKTLKKRLSCFLMETDCQNIQTQPESMTKTFHLTIPLSLPHLFRINGLPKTSQPLWLAFCKTLFVSFHSPNIVHMCARKRPHNHSILKKRTVFHKIEKHAFLNFLFLKKCQEIVWNLHTTVNSAFKALWKGPLKASKPLSFNYCETIVFVLPQPKTGR